MKPEHALELLAVCREIAGSFHHMECGCHETAEKAHQAVIKATGSTPKDKTTTRKQPLHRRQRAKAIIALYDGKVNRQGSLTDAITDLMHYADKHYIDFDQTVMMAQKHHHSEK